MKKFLIIILFICSSLQAQIYINSDGTLRPKFRVGKTNYIDWIPTDSTWNYEINDDDSIHVVADRDWVISKLTTSNLPDMTGHSGKYLSNNGTTAFWKNVKSELSASYPIVYDTTTGAFTFNYNTLNLQLTSNELNTIQDIASSSSPAFTNLTLSGDLALNGGDVTSTTNITLTPTGTINLIGNTNFTGHLLPSAPDMYNVGSFTLPFLSGHISELNSVVFAENTITLLGGWFYVTKDAGTVAEDVNSTETAIDFGKSMTVNDFILFKGNGAVEYMKILSSAGGTTYNVTRDVDGSGANSWAASTPFAVLGYNGDGRIEFNAYDTPRISIIKQGTSYSSQTELVRMGDLDDFLDYSSETYGIAIGDATNYMKYDQTNGLRIAGKGTFQSSSGNQKVVIDGSTNSLSFYGSDGIEKVKLSYLSTYGVNGLQLTDAGIYITGDNILGEYISLSPSGITASLEGLKVLNGGSISSMGEMSRAIYASVNTSNNNPGGVNYAIFGRATGGATNWAGYFDLGNVFISNNLIQSGYIDNASYVDAASGFRVNGTSVISSGRALQNISDYNLSTSDIPSGIDAANISTGLVSNTEFNYINGLTKSLSTYFTPAYGELYDASTSTITTDNSTYKNWTGATVGDCSNITGSTSSDWLIVGTGHGGTYLITVSIGFRSTVAGTYYWGVKVNGSLVADSRNISYVAANLNEPITLSCITDLSQSNYVQVGVFGPTATVTVTYLNLSITKVSN